VLAGADIPIQATLAHTTAYDKLVIMDSRYVIHGATENSGPRAFDEITLIDAPELAAHYLSQTIGSFTDLIDVSVIRQDDQGRPIETQPEKTRAEKTQIELDRKERDFFDDHYAFAMYFFEHTMRMITQKSDWEALSVYIALQRTYQSVREDTFRVSEEDLAHAGITDTQRQNNILSRLTSVYDAIDLKNDENGMTVTIKHIADRGVLLIDEKDVPMPLRSRSQAMTLFADAVIAAYADERKYFPEVPSADVKTRFGISKRTVTSYREGSRPGQ
jgi:hypothetical protein